MDENQRLAMVAQVGGISMALPMLCRMLANKDILSEPEVEILRQTCLQTFDHVSQRADEAGRKSLGELREPFDALWHKAVLAAQRRSQP